ncbi:MAG: hypothetical protein ABSD70_10225 [Terracidiphilus sp.]|jgi:hypothetical protein
MTVIVSAFVPDSGFMIAADGRRLDARTNAILTDEAKKIYAGSHPECNLVFGWAGATATDTPLCGHFDFGQQSLDFLHDKKETQYKSWKDFVSALATGLRASLIICAGGPQVYRQNIPKEGVIAAARLVGYFQQKPVQSDVIFSHSQGWLRQPEIRHILDLTEERRPEISFFSGEIEIFERTVLECPATLAETAEIARKYIKDCAAENTRYGGCTHIGFVTPNGFECDRNEKGKCIDVPSDHT